MTRSKVSSTAKRLLGTFLVALTLIAAAPAPPGVNGACSSSDGTVCVS